MRFDHVLSFLNEITPNQKVCVAMHNDGDGLCSGAILILLLEEKGVTADAKILSRMDRIDWVKEYDKVVMVDISPNELEQHTPNLLIIDHHKRSKKPACAFVNPAFDQDDVPSASALCYKVYSLAGGRRNLKWLGVLGSYTDRMLSSSLPFLNMSEFDTNVFLPSGQLDPALTGITLAFGAGYLDSSAAETVLSLLVESARREDPLYMWLERDGKAKQVYDLVEAASKEARERIRRGKIIVDHSKKFAYLDLGSPRYKIKRLAVDYLRMKYPGYVTSVSIDIGKLASFSTRSAGQDLSVIIPKAIKGFKENRHGGHVRAYGCTVKQEDKQAFVQKLLSVL